VDGRSLKPEQKALGYIGHSPQHWDLRHKHEKEGLQGRRLITNGLVECSRWPEASCLSVSIWR
jgi:hypothetical protein